MTAQYMTYRTNEVGHAVTFNAVGVGQMISGVNPAVARLERDIFAKTQTSEIMTTMINAADIPDNIKWDLIALSESRTSTSEVQKQLLSSTVSIARRQVEIQKQSKQAVLNNQEKLRTREQTLKKELETATVFQIVEQLSIRAPVDGMVLSLVTKTVGGVVSAGQPMVEVLHQRISSLSSIRPYKTKT
jgi:hypothetical protein